MSKFDPDYVRKSIIRSVETVEYFGYCYGQGSKKSKQYIAYIEMCLWELEHGQWSDDRKDFGSSFLRA